MQGAIFDLDGTLLDSMGIWRDYGALYLQGLGLPVPDSLAERLLPLSLFQSAQFLKEQFALAQPAQEIAAQLDSLIAGFYRERAQLKPGVLQYLRALTGAGVRICAATATDRHLIEPALHRLGIFSLFSFTLTCQEAGAGKDRPDIYLQALARLQTSREETMVFEDALYAARTAKSQGFQVCAVYDDSARGETAQLQQLADYYITSFLPGDAPAFMQRTLQAASL